MNPKPKHQYNVILLQGDRRYSDRIREREEAIISAAALRMRRMRARRKAGKVVVQIEVTSDFQEYLIEYAGLWPESEDHTKIAEAVERLHKSLLVAKEKHQ
jgi:hypothetical protein